MQISILNGHDFSGNSEAGNSFRNSNIKWIKNIWPIEDWKSSAVLVVSL